jgi:hypothetical protein
MQDYGIAVKVPNNLHKLITFERLADKFLALLSQKLKRIVLSTLLISSNE